MVWIKARNGAYNNSIQDTLRGPSQTIISNNTDQSGAYNFLGAFNANGFTINTNNLAANNIGTTYVPWSFRRAPKFFDIVTYTGNGASGRQIAHGLGVAPGFITTKSLSTSGDWNSYHRSATGDLILNSIAAQAGSRSIITAADATTFTVSGAANTNGVTYIAYFFAHDPSPGGIIQCGSFLGGSSVNLGWTPQFLIYKSYDGSGNWTVIDKERGFTSGNDNYLTANTANTEASANLVNPSLTGFTTSGLSTFDNYIYMAIREEGV